MSLVLSLLNTFMRAGQRGVCIMLKRSGYIFSILILLSLFSHARADEVATRAKDVAGEKGAILPEDLIDIGQLESEAAVFRELVVSSSATMKEKRTLDTAFNITVLTREDIDALRPRDVADLFRAIPGLDTFRFSDRHMVVAPAGLSYVRVNQYLVMVDGIPFPTERAGGAEWPSLPIPIDQIERIEYLAGPKSALYGPNAAGGVINVITRRANPKLWGETPSTASVQGGTQNFSKVAVAVNEKRDKTAFTAWATNRSSDGFGVPTYPQGVPMAGEVDGDESDCLSVGLTMNRELREGESLRFGLNVYKSDFERFITDATSNTIWDTDRTHFVSNIVYNKKLRHNQNFTFMINHQNRDDDLSAVPYETLGRTEDFENFEHTQFEARHVTNHYNGNTFTFGASYNRISGEGYEYEAKHSLNDFSLYGLADIRVNEKDNVLVGLNTYSNSETDSAFTFNTSFLHKLKKNEVIRLGFATGIRAPDLKVLYFNRLTMQLGPFVTVPIFEGGNPNLENEEFSQVELGYEKRWKNSSLKVDLFMKNFSERITVENVATVPGPPLFGFRNRIDDQDTDGGLLTYDKKISKKYRATFAYRYVDVDWDTINSGRYTPRHKLMLNATIKPTNAWTFNILARTTSPFYTSTTFAGAPKLDGYKTLDLTVQHHCGPNRKNTAWLKVENLFDSNHYEIFRETGNPSGAEMERLVTVGYQVRF